MAATLASPPTRSPRNNPAMSWRMRWRCLADQGTNLDVAACPQPAFTVVRSQRRNFLPTPPARNRACLARNGSNLRRGGPPDAGPVMPRRHSHTPTTRTDYAVGRSYIAGCTLSCLFVPVPQACGGSRGVVSRSTPVPGRWSHCGSGFCRLSAADVSQQTGHMGGNSNPARAQGIWPPSRQSVM